MEQTSNNESDINKDQKPEKKGYLFFVRMRIFLGVIIIIMVLWLLNGLVNILDENKGEHKTGKNIKGDHAATPKTTEHSQTETQDTQINTADLSSSENPTRLPLLKQTEPKVPEEESDPTFQTEDNVPVPGHEEDDLLSELGLTSKAPKGVPFATALIMPLSYELKERWWGWRPNDILNVTDNVNNFQVGVLEITRRTTVILTDRISRTSSTHALDRHLENAMNTFMISADRYWFPSAESKYKEGLDELSAYAENLKKGQANFFTRTDNLIPLLRSFEDLLGSCDENLVKTHEADGSEVSLFMADNYFFYAKGVASALNTILQAVLVDYKEILESRRATDDLHRAIESLHHAMQIDPIYITNADLSGILANHRANIAATISHAKSYLQVVITALST